MRMSTRAIADILNAAHYGPEVVINGVNTDSRVVMAHSLFVALSGERFDGHEFVYSAISGGAVAALVEHAVDADIVQIIVPDTRIALGKLARHWRALQPAHVVGLTGSCGKTTVKEMIASIFREQGQTLATLGNLNNDLGVPLTLFRLEEKHQYAVIEMGANHPGEIAYCANIAAPKVALVTIIAPAHLEGFGSIEGVAKSKAEIYQALPADGIAVINTDDDYAPLFTQCAGLRQILRFGSQNNPDVFASDVRLDAGGCASFNLHYAGNAQFVNLPVPGKHNVMNALAAASVAIACNLSLPVIADGLSKTHAVAGRLNIVTGAGGVRLIDDTYNANLASMTAALDVLASFPGKHIAVLGDMGELGVYAEQQHAKVGERAREKNIEILLTLGNLSAHIGIAFGPGAKHFSDLDDLIAELKSILSEKPVPVKNKAKSPADQITLLIKGSRSAGMERVVNALREVSGEQNSQQNKTTKKTAASQNTSSKKKNERAH